MSVRQRTVAGAQSRAFRPAAPPPGKATPWRRGVGRSVIERTDVCAAICDRPWTIVGTNGQRHAAVILVLHDVEETRDGIEKLLSADGYRVDPARNEDDAVERARRRRPDLILMSLAGLPLNVLLAGVRVRQRAGLGDDVPVVVFCVPTIPEGEEVAMANNMYVIRPDSFNQLRAFLARIIYTAA